MATHVWDPPDAAMLRLWVQVRPTIWMSFEGMTTVMVTEWLVEPLVPVTVMM